MRRPSREMIMRDLQDALWRIIEPQIDFTTDSHLETMRRAIHRFVELEANSLSMAELADALDSIEQTATLFLHYLRSRGMVGDPISLK